MESKGENTDVTKGNGQNAGDVGIILNAKGECNFQNIESHAQLFSNGAKGRDDIYYDNGGFQDGNNNGIILNHAIAYCTEDGNNNFGDFHYTDICKQFDFAGPLDANGLPKPLVVKVCPASCKPSEINDPTKAQEYKFYFFW